MANFSLDLKLARFVGWLFRPWQRRFAAKGAKPKDKLPLTLITGASSGIGAALAKELGRAGHHLFLLGQNEERLRRVVEDVHATRLQMEKEKQVFSLAVDLTVDQSVEMIEVLLEAQGFYVETLINNAGLGERDDFLSSQYQSLKHVMDVNMEVVTRLSHHFLPGMIERGEGAIMNVASIGGLAPGPHQSVYYASKAFVVNFSEALANELMGRGVYIAAVVPGPTKTAFHTKIRGQKALYYHLMWRMKPRAVARTMHRALLMRHWALITPGPFYMALGAFMRVIPGSLLTPLMGVLYKKRG